MSHTVQSPTTPTPTPVLWATLETEHLDEGIPMMHRLFKTGHLRIAYDPAQTSYVAVRAVTAIEYGPDALRSLPTTEPTPTQAHAMARLGTFICDSPNPAAAARELYDLIVDNRLHQLLAAHNITMVPAGGTGVTEPTFVSAHGRRFLTVPDGCEPAEILAYARTAFTTPNPTWTITTDTGTNIAGYLPPWADNDPSETGLPDTLLPLRLADLTHSRAFNGQPLHVDTPFGRDGARSVYEEEVFRGRIVCAPYADEGAGGTPTVTVAVVEDCVIEGLDPAGVAAVADTLRVQAAVLDQVAVDLAAARADWTANGGSGVHA